MKSHHTPIFSSPATGNCDVITLDHMRHMRDRAIVCNIGHFDSEIQVSALENMQWQEIKPQVDEITFPDGKKIILLAKGRLVNLGCATGHPSFVMSASFTNQVLAQIELWNNAQNYANKVYVLPRILDEEVAHLHLEKVGAKLTALNKKQADYINVPPKRPLQGRPLPLLITHRAHLAWWNRQSAATCPQTQWDTPHAPPMPLRQNHSK